VSLLRDTSALFHIFLTREEAITCVLDHHSDLPSAGLAVPVATRSISAAEAHVIEAHSVAPLMRAQRRDIFERASSAASSPLPVQPRSVLLQSVLDDARAALVERTNSALARLDQTSSVAPPTTVPDEFASACSPSRDLLALALDSPLRPDRRLPPFRFTVRGSPTAISATRTTPARRPSRQTDSARAADSISAVSTEIRLPAASSTTGSASSPPVELDNHAWPDSLHESEFFSRFCTCRTQCLCLARTFLFLPQHEPPTGTAASLVRSNRRLLRAALRDRDTARSHLSSS
jgi:hypothetical protein